MMMSQPDGGTDDKLGGVVNPMRPEAAGGTGDKLGGVVNLTDAGGAGAEWSLKLETSRQLERADVHAALRVLHLTGEPAAGTRPYEPDRAPPPPPSLQLAIGVDLGTVVKPSGGAGSRFLSMLDIDAMVSKGRVVPSDSESGEPHKMSSVMAALLEAEKESAAAVEAATTAAAAATAAAASALKAFKLVADLRKACMSMQ